MSVCHCAHLGRTFLGDCAGYGYQWKGGATVEPIIKAGRVVETHGCQECTSEPWQLRIGPLSHRHGLSIPLGHLPLALLSSSCISIAVRKGVAHPPSLSLTVARWRS